jgi:hypothetical protein
LNLFWLNIADFCCDYHHVMIFNLQEERANIEARVDDPEAVAKA